MLKIIKLLSLLLAITILSHGQNQNGQHESVVSVKSWTTGNAIRENVFHFTLAPSESSRTEYIDSYGYGTYKLSFHFGKADKRISWDRDKWQVILQEVLSKANKKEKVGCNLLSVSGCGGGGDYFPKEDNAAVLFPTYETKNPLEQIMQKRYYPIALPRTFWVRTFLVMLNVSKYKINGTDPTKLDSMDVSVSFRNILTEYK